MASTNNTDREEKEINVPINTIQDYAYVERLGSGVIWGGNSRILAYDVDNLYPQKVRTIKERSKSLSSACKTFSDFVRGDGWSDETFSDLVLNSGGKTAFDLLKFCADEKSEIGFALHVNYNISGQITEINEIDYEALRFNKEGKLVWRKDWSKNIRAGEVIYNLFDPEKVKDEIIEAGGIDKYTGQIFYWKGTNKIYALSIFDAVLDDGQYQAESALFKLRNVQNDFTASGAFKYPKAIENTDEWKEARNQLKKGTGANNAGKIVLVSTIPDQESKSSMWESFERNNVDKLFELQNKEAKEDIFGIFRQPPILNAVNPSGGWPNQQEMKDAFDYYNSIVEQDRKDIEKVFQKLIDVSVWAGFKCEIKPKQLIKNGTGDSINNNQ